MEVFFPGGKKVHVKHGGFVIATDQPVERGGENTAPNPFDLFLAALGACAGYYVQDFVTKRGFPADQLKLDIRFTRDEKTKMVSLMRIDITLPAGFPEKYRQAAVNAAELCLVAQHLKTPPKIEIRTV